MGLIQDLQGRKLTGCGGCDAIRSGLYKGLDLITPKTEIQAASTHGSFTASALGAFSESALQARGGDCAVVVDSIIGTSGYPIFASVLADGETATITGTDFGGATSTIVLNSAQDGSGTEVNQTVDAWSDISVDITVAQGGLVGRAYLFVDCQTSGTPIDFTVNDNARHAMTRTLCDGTTNEGLIPQWEGDHRGVTHASIRHADGEVAVVAVISEDYRPTSGKPVDGCIGDPNYSSLTWWETEDVVVFNNCETVEEITIFGSPLGAALTATTTLGCQIGPRRYYKSA